MCVALLARPVNAAADTVEINSREDEVSGWILPFLRKGLARGVSCLSLDENRYFNGIRDGRVLRYGSDVP